MMNPVSRRAFLQTITAAGVGISLSPALRAAEQEAASNKLRIAVVGVGGRGYANLEAIANQEIVALCDVDERAVGPAVKRCPQAKRYTDYRKMLDSEKLDAVLVATPDHTHIPASVAAMRQGLPVYTEKPLGHNLWEVRLAQQVAREQKVVTQMGTQIHAGENYRRVVELVQSNAIGTVEEVHVWVGKGWGGGARPMGTPPVPAGLEWDLWLGPAAERAYSPVYLPANWRRWWDFGTGTLGDMGCHYIDLPFWALNLTAPTRVSAAGPLVDSDTAPAGLTVEYEFPAVGTRPSVKLKWYDGDLNPKTLFDIKLPGSGVLFVGSQGKLLATYGDHRLFPEEKFADFKPPEPSIAPSIGHHAEWLHAIRTGGKALCDFAYSGPLTETVLLGAIAYRLGEPIEWDAENLKVKHNSKAEELIKMTYRKGWGLE